MAGSYTLSGRSIRKLSRDHKRLAKTPTNLRQTLPDATGQIDVIPPEPALFAKNNTEETIPAYGAMRVTNVITSQVSGTMRQVAIVAKPNSSDDQRIVFNGPRELAPGATHRIANSPVCRMKYTGSTPSVGDSVGPSSGNWAVAKDQTPQVGFVLGVIDASAGIALFQQGSSSTAVNTNLRWRNVDTEAAPAWAVLEVCGGGEDAEGIYVECRKPSQDGASSGFIRSLRIGHSYYFNLGEEVAPYDDEDPNPVTGYCTQNFPARAAYESGDGTPANGEMWGPQFGKWLLDKNKQGFKILGGVEAADGDIPASVIVTRPTTHRHFYVAAQAGDISIPDADPYRLSFDTPSAVNISDFDWDENTDSAVVKTDGLYHLSVAISFGEQGGMGGSSHDEVLPFRLTIVSSTDNWASQKSSYTWVQGFVWGKGIVFDLSGGGTLAMSALTHNCLAINTNAHLKVGMNIAVEFESLNQEMDEWDIEYAGSFTAVSVD